MRSVLPAYGLEEKSLKMGSFASGLVSHTWKITTKDKQFIIQKDNQSVFEKSDSISVVGRICRMV